MVKFAEIRRKPASRDAGVTRSGWTEEPCDQGLVVGGGVVDLVTGVRGAVRGLW